MESKFSEQIKRTEPYKPGTVNCLRPEDLPLIVCPEERNPIHGLDRKRRFQNYDLNPSLIKVLNNTNDSMSQMTPPMREQAEILKLVPIFNYE